MSKPTTNRFSPEVRSRPVRMVLDHQAEHASQWTAINSIAGKIGCTGETLRGWVRQAGQRPGAARGPTMEERERIKALERENRELRQAKDPAQGVGIFCPGGARPPVQAMIAFIDGHRRAYGSSRSANCCLSPRRPTTPMRPGVPIRPGSPPGPSAISRRPTFGAFSRRTSASTGGEGVAAARAGGNERRSMHGGSADAADGPARHGAGPRGPYHRQQSCGRLPAGPGEPAVPGAPAECAMAVGLYPRRQLAGAPRCW